MARYYLNIRNGTGFVEDLEGLEFPGLEEARHEAIDGVRSLLSEEVRQGRIDMCGLIEIVDESGATLFCVPFGDAVEIYMGSPAS